MNLKKENLLWKKGYRIIVGVDEAGRGPLAGPVVAGAFALINTRSKNNFMPDTSPSQRWARSSPPKFPRLAGDHAILSARQAKNYFFRSFLLEVRDSKQLSAQKREKIYNEIIKSKNFAWGIGVVSEKIIDKINILNATKLAMKRAVINLRTKYKNIDYILVDGNMKFDWDYDYESIIKGDQKVFSISAGSIIAKVYRDKLMEKAHKKYPQYGFLNHKGYGTAEHLENLKKFGACKIHRKTFYPIKKPS